MAEQQRLKCRAIVEILGAPKEHVEKTLNMYVENIKKDKDLKVIKEDFAEIKEKGELFAKFVELEFWVSGIDKLAWFCFDYMPSNIEILEPDDVNYKAKDMMDFFNDLQARLHKLDMMLKNSIAAQKVLEKNYVRLVRNMVMIQLEEKSCTLEEMSKKTGLPEEFLAKFVKGLVDKGKIKKKDDKYSLK